MCISCWEYQTKGLAAAAEYEEEPWQAFVTAKLVNFDIGLRQKSCRELKQKLTKTKIFGQFAITNVAFFGSSVL